MWARKLRELNLVHRPRDDYPPRAPAFAPFRFMVLLVAGWMHRHQHQAIEFLRAEKRVLRDRIDERRLRFTDAERRMLALAGEPAGRSTCEGLRSTAFAWGRRGR